MPERGEVFQYALLQVVPSLARDERLNVGVVLFSRRLRFLALRFRIDPARLAALDPSLDLDALRTHLEGLAAVAAGDPGAGPIAALDQSERFGWITAASSTSVQPTPVHTGLCDDGEVMIERLCAELVDPPPPPGSA